jgi:hypothetical protein
MHDDSERNYKQQVSEDQVVEQWVEAWDSLVSLERRRLSCIALFALLGAGVCV